MPNQKIGFIGLGNMGREMAANLLKKGYELVVRDQNSETVEQFVSQLGGRAAKAGADFSEVDILILMLPSGPIVKSVLSDSNGITSALEPRGVYRGYELERTRNLSGAGRGLVAT